MKLLKGIVTDVNPIDQPEGTWRKAKNKVISKVYNALVNEDGNSVHANLLSGEVIVGVAKLPNDNLVVLISGPTDRIAKIDKSGVVTTVVASNLLDFSPEHPFQVEFHFNFRNDVIIAFTNDVSPPRILNVDSLPFAINPTTKAPLSSNFVNFLLLFPETNNYIITPTIRNTGGSLKTGSYFFSIAYRTDEGRLSYGHLYGPAYITDEPNGTVTSDGAPAESPSSKSVSLNITNLDTRYSTGVLGVLKSFNGVYSFHEVKEFAITASTATVIYTGSEIAEPALLEEALLQPVKYTSAKTITQLNDSLYLANLKSEDEIDLQEYANRVTINWRSTTGVANLPNFATTSVKTFGHGEVYAFYIVFRLKSGGRTKAFHIPGRPPVAGDTDTTTPYAFGEPAYVIEDTTSIGGALTNMGYWENEAEEYPSDLIEYNITNVSYTVSGSTLTIPTSGLALRRDMFPIGGLITLPSTLGGTVIKTITSVNDTATSSVILVTLDNVTNVVTSGGVFTKSGSYRRFPTGKVRHHRFPTMHRRKGSLGGAAGLDYGRTYIDRLTIDVANVIIPADYLGKIEGWEIYFAKKSVANSLVLGQSLFHYAARRNNIDVNLLSSSTGNYQLHTTSFTGTSRYVLNKNFIRFGANNLRKFTPSISPFYIRNEIQYRYAPISTSLVRSSSKDNNGQVGILFTTEPEIEGLGSYWNYFNNPSGFVTVASVPDSSKVRRVDFVEYIPDNVISSTYNNENCESTLLLSITQGDTLSIASAADGTGDNLALPRISTGVYNTSRAAESTYLTSLCQAPRTVHASFDRQELVMCDNVAITSAYVSSLNNIIGGDRFLAVTTEMRMSKVFGAQNIPQNDPRYGHKCIKRFISESPIQERLRHQDADPNSFYFPKSPLESRWSDSFLTSINSSRDLEIPYNSDYTLLNELNVISVFRNLRNFIAKFPNRIIRSVKQQRENPELGWRRFLPNDYYETVRNRGEIINLQGVDDVLFIHNRYGLFKTRGNEVLQVGTREVTIGSGNIFEFDPQEIMSSDQGYLGNQNTHGSILCKIGYVFSDVEQGKLFIISDDIKEITAQGNRVLFQELLKFSENLDNPFFSKGISFAYDEKYNRLLISKRDGVNSWVYSYSPETNQFISEHDYKDSYLLNTRTKVYSFKNLAVYKHNQPNKCVFYGTTFPSFIEYVLNIEPSESKVFFNLNWESEVRDSNNKAIFDETFSEIYAYNDYQCTGIIPLENLTNIRRTKTTWNFNTFYDIVKDRTLPFIQDNELILSNLDANQSWFDMRKMVDKYLAVRLTYSNINQNTIILYSVSSLVRRASR
jgi:hypothetical protein